jgi:propanediol dehydratase small subunit
VALGEDVPDVDDFERDDLRLSPEMHQAQAMMAAERGEEYDPLEFERRLDEVSDPDPVEEAGNGGPDE